MRHNSWSGWRAAYATALSHSWTEYMAFFLSSKSHKFIECRQRNRRIFFAGKCNVCLLMFSFVLALSDARCYNMCVCLCVYVCAFVFFIVWRFVVLFRCTALKPILIPYCTRTINKLNSYLQFDRCEKNKVTSLSIFFLLLFHFLMLRFGLVWVFMPNK